MDVLVVVVCTICIMAALSEDGGISDGGVYYMHYDCTI